MAWLVSLAVFFTNALIPMLSILNAVAPTFIAEWTALSVTWPASFPYLNAHKWWLIHMESPIFVLDGVHSL